MGVGSGGVGVGETQQTRIPSPPPPRPCHGVAQVADRKQRGLMNEAGCTCVWLLANLVLILCHAHIDSGRLLHTK